MFQNVLQTDIFLRVSSVVEIISPRIGQACFFGSAIFYTAERTMPIIPENRLNFQAYLRKHLGRPTAGSPVNAPFV